jgi:outer membrane lipoprotein-sorting protein
MRDEWAKVTTYTVRMSYRQAKEQMTEERTVDFSYKSPGWVRNDIIKGKNKGTRAVYDPEKNIIIARHPLIPLLLSYDPSDERVLTLRGEKMYEVSFPYMFKRIDWFLANGKAAVVKVETFEGAECTVIEFVAVSQGTPGGLGGVGGVVRERYWLDNKTSFPRKLVSFDKDGKELQWVILRDLRLNPAMPDNLFRL